MSDSSEEESRDVPGVALWISPPTDISINFLACLCISDNFFPFLFFLSRFLVFSPRPFALVCGLCELKELQGIKQRRKQKDAVCVTMETKLFVLPRS